LSISFSIIAAIMVLPAFLAVYARGKLAKNPDYFKQHVDITKVREHVSKKIHDYPHKLKDFEHHLLDSEHNFAYIIHEEEDKVVKKD